MASMLMATTAITTASACVGPGLSPGFWKHNVGVYLELRNGAYSDPGYTGGIVSKETMAAFLSQWTNLELLALYNQLNTKGGGAAGDAMRVDAANVFNAAADLFNY